MRILVTIILSAILFSNCGVREDNETSKDNSRELIPEPDRAERLRNEALKRLRNSDCIFYNPDTSVLSLNIRDAEGGKAFIRDDKRGSQEEYRYYSNNFQQLMSLTQHPGDEKYQISIIRVEYAKKDDYGYRKLDVDTFKTEKGIMLGMSKEDIINRLGNCYAALDSTQGSMELYYRIEAPQDTKTYLLANHRMPVYYASYKIRNGKVEKLEFGFEYP
jgi:hypothetical protein